MFGSAASRWTMTHFGVALTYFILAQLIIVAGLAFPAKPLLAPGTVATVHLLTVGWLTVLMLGALHQFVPVLAAKGGAAGASALASLIIIMIGLGGMEAGFLAWGGRLPDNARIALPLGGILVLAGVAIAAVSLSRILWRARPLPFSARFVAAGLAFLFAALGMGIVLAGAVSSPRLVPWAGALTDGLRLHLLAGLMGWFTLTAMGVSYRLLSMFTLAPEERGPLGAAVFGLSAGGLAATWALGVCAAFGAPVPNPVIAMTAAAAGLGLALYLVDMARLYHARRRRKLELNTGMALPALGALAISLCGAAGLAVHGASATAIGALGYLLVFGWLSGLGLSQLYKIVPFLTWLERYGDVLGKKAVPRVQDLVDEHRDRPWFILYFVSVGSAALFIALGEPLLWRLAALGHLIATAMIVRALWLARYGAPRKSPAAPTAPPFATPRHFSS